MYGFAVFGWSVGVYFLQMLFDNTREILLNYKTCVIWYTVVTGIISFIGKSLELIWSKNYKNFVSLLQMGPSGEQKNSQFNALGTPRH